MCYEVFNRSAAQAYLQQLRKERRMREEDTGAPSIDIDAAVQKASAVAEKIDWSGLIAGAQKMGAMIRLPALIIAGLVTAWIVMHFLISPTVWYRVSGCRLLYSVSSKDPLNYLVGYGMTIKSWSERGGQLDTPLAEFKQDEIGNIAIEPKRSGNKKTQAAAIYAKEWITLVHSSQGNRSVSLPSTHPTLAGTQLLLDKRGRLLERGKVLSPRLGKGIPFLLPKFPDRSLRQETQWSEPVEWVDTFGDWKFYWSGTLRWTLGDVEPCGLDTCVRLTYKADIRPQLWGAPGWAVGGVKRVSAQTTTSGVALFDYRHKRLIANTLSYSGLLRVPLNNLGRIPLSQRIGRPVRGVPGDILIQFQNKIDLHKN